MFCVYSSWMRMGYNKYRTDKTLFSISASDVSHLESTYLCVFFRTWFLTQRRHLSKRRPLLPPKKPRRNIKIYLHGCYQTKHRNYYHVWIWTSQFWLGNSPFDSPDTLAKIHLEIKTHEQLPTTRTPMHKKQLTMADLRINNLVLPFILHNKIIGNDSGQQLSG